MGLWDLTLFNGRRKAKTVETTAPTPKPVEDPQAKADREFEELKAASARALLELILRNGGCDGIGFRDAGSAPIPTIHVGAEPVDLNGRRYLPLGWRWW